MHILGTFALLVACGAIGSALAGRDAAKRADAGLRLIKTSEEDPGKWMTAEEKTARFGRQRGGFLDVTGASEAKLALVSKPPLKARALTFPTTLSHTAEGFKYTAKVTNCGTKQWLKTLTDFYDRFYDSELGVLAGEYLLETVTYFASRNPNATVRTVKHEGFDQRTIIATIPGSTDDLVVVGAHFDSTTVSASRRAPGADDNGSGVVVILEAMRVLAKWGFQPKNTLEFHFYAAEEPGEIGSFDVWESYDAQDKSVKAFVNQDMAGWSPSGRVSVFTDYADPGLVQYAREIARVYTGLEPTSDVCDYGCSDHYPAYVHGFPTVYVCDEPIATSSPWYHTEEDTYDKIMWDTIKRHAVFTVGFLIEGSYL